MYILKRGFVYFLISHCSLIVCKKVNFVNNNISSQTYVDRALPFGLWSAPKLFSAVADVIAWFLYSNGVEYLLHYLDDFLFFISPDSPEAFQVLQRVSSMLQWVNAPVATHKTAGPATVIPFLGILINTARMELCLPPEKVESLRSLTRMWSNKSSSTQKDLEHFLDHLSHAAMVIRPGRTFLRKLFMLTSTIHQPHHQTQLNQAVRET